MQASVFHRSISFPMNKAIIRTFQAVFTIAILIWLFHSPEKRAQMANAISGADSTWLLIGLPVALVGEVANIVRWQILMRVQGMYMSWRRSIMLFFVGLFFNLFMPGYTGGDFARLYYLMREFPDKKKEAILTVVMDRLIGMASLGFDGHPDDYPSLAVAAKNSSSNGIIVCPDRHADRIRYCHRGILRRHWF